MATVRTETTAARGRQSRLSLVTVAVRAHTNEGAPRESKRELTRTPVGCPYRFRTVSADHATTETATGRPDNV